MRHFIYIVIAAAAAVLFISCNGRENGEIHKILTQWDNLLENNPEAVSDSLKTINPQTLSRENRAYYNLLKTTSTDGSATSASITALGATTISPEDSSETAKST